MQIKDSDSAARDKLTKKVEELSGQNVFSCYQCGRCSAGCPMVSEMDVMPSNVMRSLQLGDTEVLEKNTFWVCATCYTCDVRCPKDIDIAKVMEALRQIKLRKNVNHVDLKEISTDDDELPQIALIANLRKNTS